MIQILYLNMNDAKVGQKIFKCSTTIDYFLLQNKSPYKETIINDYNNSIYFEPVRYHIRKLNNS